VIIVSNTGPLIGLSKINQIGLLRQLTAAVYIPPGIVAKPHCFHRTPCQGETSPAPPSGGTLRSKAEI
jgi:hypothetical protein